MEINEELINYAKLRANMLDFFHPVGSYYETSNANFNPNTAWGGTWVEDTKGRVLVAQNTGTFKTIGATGGNESNSTSYTPAGSIGDHTLTLDEIPKHAHGLEYPFPGINSGTAYGHVQSGSYVFSKLIYTTSENGGGKSHNHPFTGKEATLSISSLQPYIVVKRWHRTA